MKTCNTCQYWTTEDDDTGLGECHKNAPVPIAICGDEFKAGSPDAGFTAWPKTEGENWCGEFAAKEEWEKPTLFPWGDARIDIRTTRERNWLGKRPRTFEEFIAIGRKILVGRDHGLTKNIGAISIAKLDVLFAENGYALDWMES